MQLLLLALVCVAGAWRCSGAMTGNAVFLCRMLLLLLLLAVDYGKQRRRPMKQTGGTSEGDMPRGLNSCLLEAFMPKGELVRRKFGIGVERLHTLAAQRAAPHHLDRGSPPQLAPGWPHNHDCP